LAAPARIWNKPGLSAGETEQVRLHPYRTERVLLGAGIAAVGVASSSTHWRSQTMPHFTAFWGWSRGFILLTVTFPMLITLRHRLHGLTTAPERPTVV